MATDRELKARLSWRAKSMAISAIDIAEGVGITRMVTGTFPRFGSRLDLGGGDLPGINGI